MAFSGKQYTQACDPDVAVLEVIEQPRRSDRSIPTGSTQVEFFNQVLGDVDAAVPTGSLTLVNTNQEIMRSVPAPNIATFHGVRLYYSDLVAAVGGRPSAADLIAIGTFGVFRLKISSKDYVEVQAGKIPAGIGLLARISASPEEAQFGVEADQVWDLSVPAQGFDPVTKQCFDIYEQRVFPSVAPNEQWSARLEFPAGVTLTATVRAACDLAGLYRRAT